MCFFFPLLTYKNLKKALYILSSTVSCDSCAKLLQLISLIDNTDLSNMMNATSLCAGCFQGCCRCTQSYKCIVQSSV